jgi:methylated-DNA-[protein]-cysteine S-methyltransferase
MSVRGLAFFDTAIGRCGIAWSGQGIVGVQLPERSDRQTRARLLRRFPDMQETQPPSHVQRAIGGIVALLEGQPSDLSPIALDMDGVPPFHRRIYEVARAIAPGATRSYGDIAAQLGEPGEARTVGEALAQNPFPIIVPCHRVLAAGGKVGGFSANGGIATKLRLLSIEGAQPGGAPALFADLPLAIRPPRRNRG